jgi:phosphate-selective porin OprO/OprP
MLMLILLLLSGNGVLGNEAVSVTSQSEQVLPVQTQLDQYSSDQVSSTQPQTPSTDQMPSASGLTPRHKFKPQTPVLLAQQPTPPQSTSTDISSNPARPLPPPSVFPTPKISNIFDKSDLLPLPRMAQAAVPPSFSRDSSVAPDSFVYSELDRLAAEIAQIRQDKKKQDTQKTWITPKLTGRIFLDSYSVDQGDRSDYKNKTGVREMQFAITGNGFDSFDYKLELSLSPTDARVNLVDNWIGVKNIPLLGYVRAGHYKPETGIAYLASGLHTPLSEYVGPSGTFGFGRRLGVSSEHLFAKDRVRLFYGVFQGDTINSSRYINEDNQGNLFNIRLSVVPIFENEGRRTLHFGGNYSYVNTKKNQAGMGVQPGAVSWYSNSLQTGNFANDQQHRYGFEFALQNGPVSMSSEVSLAQFSGYNNMTPARTATGGYLELGYFLTGDHRSYSLQNGTFGATKVKHPFHPFRAGDCNLIDGLGAWQLILIWSYLDLTDWRNNNTVNTTNGGFQHDLTFGVNWFWNSNIRLILEYIHSQQNYGTAGQYRHEDILGTSLRLHF